ncbi:transposase, partial [Alicyclobacillus macrosporangiidus]
FHEGNTLQAAVEAYRERYGHYPEAVLADRAYRTRENLRYCKERGIRLSGPPLGRPSKTARTEQARIEKQDAAERNEIEGKIGEGKRLYGLGLIRTRLRATSETVIALQLLVMNLERRLRLLLYLVFARLERCPISTALANS